MMNPNFSGLNLIVRKRIIYESNGEKSEWRMMQVRGEGEERRDEGHLHGDMWSFSKIVAWTIGTEETTDDDEEVEEDPDDDEVDDKLVE